SATEGSCPRDPADSHCERYMVLAGTRRQHGPCASGSGVSDPLAFLPQFDLADLARDCHREGLPHLDIARDLEVGELAGAEFAHLLGAERVEPVLEDHPR